jgi:hypothetical protein
LSVTSSQTPTSSITPSQTQTAAPSVDYVGIAKAAAAESDAKTGGIVGGLVAVLLLGIVAFKIKQRHEAHLRRSRRLKTPARNYEEEARSLYGVQPTLDAGGTVMYQVNMPQSQPQIPGPGRSYQSNSSRRMSNRRN